MIKLCENLKDLEFLPADPFCARITGYAKTYGFDKNFARFWTIGDEYPEGAICMVDGNMTIYSETSDADEIRAFIECIGFKTVSCDKKLADKIGIPIRKSSIIVRYTGTKSDPEIQKEPDYKAIYGILCECGFDMPEYRTFLEDIAIRVNKGVAKVAWEPQENPGSCAMIMFDGTKSSLMGCVGTKKQFRGNGIASVLVRKLASESASETFLFCREDSLLEFYKKIGFEETGRWCEI